MLENKEKIIIAIIGVILVISLVIYFLNKDEEEYIEVNNEIADLTEEIVEEEEEVEEIVLHIIGAVKNPGIVKIKEG